MSLVVKDQYTDLLSAAVVGIRQQHEQQYQEWMPHEWVPWDLGKNFAFLGGEDYDPSQSVLDEESLAATTLLLLHKDQLPSYHRILTQKAPGGTELFSLIGRWTGEEAAHAVPLRDYLVVTRATDPAALELRRLHWVMQGYFQRDDTFELSSIESLILVALIERVGARLSRGLSEHTEDIALKHIAKHIAFDDNLHAHTFTELIKAGLDADFSAVSALVLRFAAAACPLGEDWGEGFPEVEIVQRKLYTPEIHKQVVDSFVADLGLIPRFDA